MSHIYVSVLFLLLAIVVGIVVSTSQIQLWKKIVVMLALGGSALVSYRTLNNVYGYPAILQDDFDEVLIISYFADREGGVMYIWLKDPEGGEPRAFKMPYSAKLHKQLQSQSEANGGKPFKGKISTKVGVTNPFNETTEEVDVEVEPGDLPAWPLKQ